MKAGVFGEFLPSSGIGLTHDVRERGEVSPEQLATEVLFLVRGGCERRGNPF